LYANKGIVLSWALGGDLEETSSRQGVSFPPTASDLSSAAVVKPSLALVIVHGTNPALTTVLCRFTIADLA